MGAKIRNAELSKIPNMIIIGEKEVNSKTISIRRRFAKNMNGIDLKMYIETLINEIKDRDLRPKDDE